MAMSNTSWAVPAGGETFDFLTERTFGWPSAPAGQPTLIERVLELAYKLFTPTLELPWLQNFGWLGPKVCRGAQPSRAAFRRLKDMGVDTVINLRLESDDEEAHVKALGMKYLYFPLDPLAPPTHAQTLAFLHAISAPEHGRVYFHCYHGADRTGVLAACTRITLDGWSLAEAIAELDAYRFHHSFQQQKLVYLKQFAAYWSALPEDQQARVLHKRV